MDLSCQPFFILENGNHLVMPTSKPMKTAHICLILSIFTFFANCSMSQVFLSKESPSRESLSSIYTSVKFQNFNPRYFSPESSHKSFLNVRIASGDSRIDRTEIQVIEYSPQFRIDVEKNFPRAEIPNFKIESYVMTGQLISPPGPTGLEIHYTVEKVKRGSGASLDSAWNEYNKAAYTRKDISRKEKWETVKDGLWLSEESELLQIGELHWKHKPGSLDFFHPITEFKVNNTATASLYYDYSLNRYQKLKIENIPDSSNLVFEGKEGSLFFLSGKLKLKYNSL